MSTTTSSLNVLTDTKPSDNSLPAFMVSTTRGFLPRNDPIVALPEEFALLESLLTRMPIQTLSGEPGLLASFSLGDHVNKELIDLSSAIDKYAHNLPLMNALYRDYCFLASAYLLEPCHKRFMRGEEYGLGRQSLPECIALPLVKVAKIAGFKPFMEYAGSYALFNYRLVDPSLGLEYSNLRLIRAFELGLDPSSSEAGFVLVHVAMVRHSALLVQGSIAALEGAEKGDREAFDEGMECIIDAMKEINRVMNMMWSRSKPNAYTSFRTFIFGITKQSMFPHGVIYSGVSDEPFSFRGESGANDSMIPLLDNLLEIHMPASPLTAILRDFRSYRPAHHRDFLSSVAAAASAAQVRRFALDTSAPNCPRRSAALYVRALDQVRDFRWRHWCFAREYILKQTRHPTATGGSPIVTWLPNQLEAVLTQMLDAAVVSGEGGALEEIVKTARTQREILTREVAKYCAERGVAAE